MATSPEIESQRRSLDRRQFLSGTWRVARDVGESRPMDGREFATILVQARPERLPAVERVLQSIGEFEISRSGSVGRLSVVVALSRSFELAGILESISDLPGVLAATLTDGGLAGGAA